MALRRRDGRAEDGSGPVERLVLRTPTMFRRRLIAGALIAIIVVTAVAAALAWRQYRDNENQAVNDLNARVALVSVVVNTYFSGGVATLGAVSKAPSVVAMNPVLMRAYFGRVMREPGWIFNGAMAWANRSGETVASTSPGPPVNVGDRFFFRQVLATGKPYVSAGIIGRRLHQPVVAVAVPTRDAKGRISGVLAASIRLRTLDQAKALQSLGVEGLTIVDRDGRLLLAGLAKASNPALIARVRKVGHGDDTDTAGLQGGSHHIVSFATATVPDWIIAIDRPASQVYASARRSLLLEAFSLGAAVLAVLLILAALVKRSRRDLEARGGQAQSWSDLTQTLSLASTPGEVADVLLETVEGSFPDAVVVVTLDSETGQEIRASSGLPGWRRVQGDSRWLREIATLTAERSGTRSLEKERELRDLYLAFGRRLKAVHLCQVESRPGAPVGGVALLTERSRLTKTEWELLGAFASQAGQALERARAFEHEHEVAMRLQQSLLPTTLPETPGVSLAGIYMAGGDGVAVGGDWYDAVERPDGIVHLCVGDVSGRGVEAATIMGRQRGTFRAYAYDCVSPAEILRRMIRHMSDDEMITATCVSIDPLEGTITYSSAGHPPPLLLDCGTNEVDRLDRAVAPPLGIAEATVVVEERLALPDHARLAMYTDGLVERRGASIDDGIDVLAQTMIGSPSVTAPEAMTAISHAIGPPSDDVALMLASIDPAMSFAVELPATPELLRPTRRRLRAWLARAGFEEEPASEIVLAVAEACNNAVEHAYDGDAPATLSLSASLDGDLLHVEVTDRGRWLESGPSDERGRGIHLMNALMDTVEVNAGPDGTTIVLERRRAAVRMDGGAPVTT
jgi:anti-sigma regulatory factor (Ser/Thr protein kinase)